MSVDPEAAKLFANVPEVGKVYPAPAAVVQMPNGQRFAVPQVAVMIMSQDALANIAAHTAATTAKLIFDELELRGVIPPSPPRQDVVDSPETPPPEQGDS